MGERIDNMFTFSIPTCEMDLTQTFYYTLNHYALPYGGQNPSVKALFIHRDIADNSNCCEDMVGVQFKNLDKLIYAGNLSAKKELTEQEKAIQEIHALFTGKMKPSDIIPISNRLREAKQEMGDRLVTGSIPKHENQPKTFKL